MRSRPAPNPADYAFDRRALANDVQVKTWLQRLKGTSNKTLTQSDIAFVLSEVHKRRSSDFRADLVIDELRRTCPVLSYPELTDSVQDLGLMFAQPEMVRFWGGVQGQRNRKGPSPCFGWTKALLAVLAMTGKTTHGKDAFDDLQNIPALREMFAATEQRAADLAHDEDWAEAPRAERWERLPDYTSVMRNIPRLTDAIRGEGIKANIEMLKALREKHPDVGRRLIIDGKAIATWVPQAWAEKDSDRDQFLRRRVPEAGYRAYTYGRGGKTEVNADGVKRRELGVTTAWRGFYLVTLLDQATGLPVIWTVFDAAVDEATAIIPLLSELFQLWPDVGTELLVGDSSWDSDNWCELLERSYGIHPIFNLHDQSEVRFATQHSKHVDGKFLSLSGQGQPRCIHNQYLPIDSIEIPSRSGLRPGQLHPKEKAFRIRFKDDHGPRPLGRVGLSMCVDWSRLTYYPHHAQGRPDLYAVRVAMLRRLKQVESWHNHLESGLRIGPEGGDRSRLAELAKQETLVTLAALATTSIAVADQRLNHGMTVPLPAPPRPQSTRAIIAAPNGNDDGQQIAPTISSPKLTAVAASVAADSERSVIVKPAAANARLRNAPVAASAGLRCTSSTGGSRVAFSFRLGLTEPRRAVRTML
jgi:hypothetical protein